MVWTNAMGVAFTASLLAVGDRGATFAFPEDGLTNLLPLSALSAESSAQACRLAGYIPIPPKFAALFAHARRELDKVGAKTADGRFSKDESRRRQAAVLAAFRKACLRRGATKSECDDLERRLMGSPPPA